MCELDELLEGARRGGRGKKLQLPAGREETRVKISDIRRCWTEVSYREVVIIRDAGTTGRVA